MDQETALADVFNREYQAHPEGQDWKIVMRAVAYEIATVLHPDSADLRNRFLHEANMSGLFPDGVVEF
jgi:hypothetical protein